MNDRTYSTRELGQMWNVSESTVKRWADCGDLRCYRTPGGHRKFSLSDIYDFQLKRGFEATGLLTTQQWEDPDLETAVNEKKFDRVRESIFYLACQNQRYKIENLLERLYMRGMGLAELYDDILMPICEKTDVASQKKELSIAQEKLIINNLEEALYFLFPRVIRRRQNGKLALCAGPQNDFCISPINAIARIVEVEGWDCLNLGPDVPFDAMAEMVEKEPVNLVCIVSCHLRDRRSASRQFQRLYKAASGVRIPVVLGGAAFSDDKLRKNFPHDDYFSSFRAFRRQVIKLGR